MSTEPDTTATETTQTETSPKNWIPGLNTLGRGYDVFGRYAHPSSVYNARIFQDFSTPTEEENYGASINGIAYDVPELVSIVEEHSSEESFVEGSSISQFQTALDVKMKMSGRYKYYSGEAKFAFHQENQSSSELYYTRFSALARSYRLALPDSEMLMDRLDPAFDRALNTNDASDNTPEAIDAFFAKYGTHYLSEVVMGGRNTYFATVDKSAVSSKLSVKASVKASYNTLVASAKVSVDSAYYSEESVAATHSETGIETVGGDATIAPLMLTDESAYAQWLASISTDPGLVDFTENSLRPIWELVGADFPDRKEALENRFEELSGASNSNFTQGTAKHGEAIYPPWGEKADWNLFLTPAVIGLSEGSNSADYDNAILNFSYGEDTSVNYPDHWQVKAKYRFRTGFNDGKTVKWHYDGVVNYMLVPKYAYLPTDLSELTYDTYDSNVGVFTNDGVPVYSFDEVNNQILDDEENVVLSDVFVKGNQFYQKRQVSKLEKKDGSDILGLPTPPDEDQEWNSIISFRANNFEDEDKVEDNALVYWQWKEHDYSDAQEVMGSTDFAYFSVKYRKGTKNDHVMTLNKDNSYYILWVLTEFSAWTGGSGVQQMKLPSHDPYMESWELIASPMKMGNMEEGSDQEWSNSSLLMTKCLLTRGETDWTIEGRYLWVDNSTQADSVAWGNGQVECLFVHSSILVDPGF